MVWTNLSRCTVIWLLTEGGWTNVNYHFGDIISYKGNLNGISTQWVSSYLINWQLKTAFDLFNNCSTNGWIKITEFTQQFINEFNFSEIKVNAKSYSLWPDVRCGWILRYVSYKNFSEINSFDDRNVLGRCDNNNTNGNYSNHGYSEQTDSSDLEFKFQLSNWKYRVISLSAACGWWTNAIQVKSIMVR